MLKSRAKRALMAACLLPGTAWAASPPPNDGGLTLLNRVTWGATESSAARLHAMGPQRWLDWQLHPTPADVLPPEAQAQIDALPISHQSMTDLVAAMVDRSKAANALVDPAEKQAAQQARQQALNDVARQTAARDILRWLDGDDIMSDEEVQTQ